MWFATSGTVLAIAAFGLAGCGGDDDDIESAGGSGATGAESAAAGEDLEALGQDCAEQAADVHSGWFDCMRAAGLECDPSKCGPPTDSGDATDGDDLVTSDEYISYCDVFPTDGQCS
jgi:hypothetical protein